MLNMVYAVYHYMLYESASCPLINTVMMCALQQLRCLLTLVCVVRCFP